jgi:hypothetical protein
MAWHPTEHADSTLLKEEWQNERVEKVLAYLPPKLSPITVHPYRIAATKIKHTFAEFFSNQIRPKHVAALKLAMVNTLNMANRVLSFLKTVFSYALEWQIVDSPTCVDIKHHAEGKQQPYVTSDEYAAIYAHANLRMQAIRYLLYLTG